MHGPTLARTQGWTPGWSGGAGPGTLEYRLPRHGTSRCRARRAGRSRRRLRWTRRGLVHRTRSGLGHNHARRRLGWRRPCGWLFSHRWRWRRSRYRCGRRRFCWWRGLSCRGRRRNWSSRTGRRGGRRRHSRRRRWNRKRRSGGGSRNYQSRWSSRGRRRRSGGRGLGSGCGRRGLRFYRRRYNRGTRRRRRGRGGWLLLGPDGIQNIAWLGNMRQVNLGLDLVAFGAHGTCSPAGRLRLFGAEVGPYLHGFVVFNGTGVSLFLSDSDFRKCIENSFTLNFQLPGQIVDSNLHPPFLPSELSR